MPSQHDSEGAAPYARPPGTCDGPPGAAEAPSLSSMHCTSYLTRALSPHPLPVSLFAELLLSIHVCRPGSVQTRAATLQL